MFFYHIRDLLRIRSVLDFSTAHAISIPLMTWLLQFILLLPPQNPVNSPSAHPELSLLSVLSLRLPSPPTLNKSYRYTGLMFRNALNTKSFLLHTTCFSSPIRYLSATSPFSQLDPHNRLPWSPSFIFHLSHVSKSQTVLFDLQHLSYGIKFPTLSVLHSIPQCSSWFACSNPSPVVNLSWRHHSQLKTYLFAK